MKNNSDYEVKENSIENIKSKGTLVKVLFLLTNFFLYFTILYSGIILLNRDVIKFSENFAVAQNVCFTSLDSSGFYQFNIHMYINSVSIWMGFLLYLWTVFKYRASNFKIGHLKSLTTIISTSSLVFAVGFFVVCLGISAQINQSNFNNSLIFSDTRFKFYGLNTDVNSISLYTNVGRGWIYSFFLGIFLAILFGLTVSDGFLFSWLLKPVVTIFDFDLSKKNKDAKDENHISKKMFKNSKDESFSNGLQNLNTNQDSNDLQKQNLNKNIDNIEMVNKDINTLDSDINKLNLNLDKLNSNFDKLDELSKHINQNNSSKNDEIQEHILDKKELRKNKNKEPEIFGKEKNHYRNNLFSSKNKNLSNDDLDEFKKLKEYIEKNNKEFDKHQQKQNIINQINELKEQKNKVKEDKKILKYEHKLEHEKNKFNNFKNKLNSKSDEQIEKEIKEELKPKNINNIFDDLLKGNYQQEFKNDVVDENIKTNHLNIHISKKDDIKIRDEDKIIANLENDNFSLDYHNPVVKIKPVRTEEEVVKQNKSVLEPGYVTYNNFKSNKAKNSSNNAKSFSSIKLKSETNLEKLTKEKFEKAANMSVKKLKEVKEGPLITKVELSPEFIREIKKSNEELANSEVNNVVVKETQVKVINDKKNKETFIDKEIKERLRKFYE